MLEKITMVNQAWQYQAAVIKELCEKYNVEYIGIDLTGPGSGVFELVKNFFPRATPILYSIDVKTRLVLKGQEVIGNRRIEWDAGWSDNRRRVYVDPSHHHQIQPAHLCG